MADGHAVYRGACVFRMPSGLVATGPEDWFARSYLPVVAGESDEVYCHRCGGPNIVWSAPSPLWNAVMRGGSINGDEIHDGIVCPVCFAQIAEADGIASIWRFYAERVPVRLETITPSGRVWDETTWMWREPEQPRDLHAHVCLMCSPDGRLPGHGCINCRQTGMDQTPCQAEGHEPQCPHGCCGGPRTATSGSLP